MEIGFFWHYLILFIIGIFPCIIWLLFYLRQDVHPESNAKVLEIFILGALCVPLIALIENKIGNFVSNLFPNLFFAGQSNPTNLQIFLYYILIIGFWEEFFKYLIVKIRVINSSHFDEAIDAMLYLIIAGLGIAASENVSSIIHLPQINEAIYLSILRLATAIFLHTLAAGILGFFLALSLRFKKTKKIFIIFSGIAIASIFHGVYDGFLTKIENATSLFDFLIPIGIIALMALILYFFLIKVKKLPRSCEV